MENLFRLVLLFNISQTEKIIEFLHNSKFPAKSWQDPASIEGEEQNKKIVPTQD